MNALITIEQIMKTKLLDEDLSYCLVNDKKLPFTKDNTIAKVNNESDFVKLHELLDNANLETYAGVGISVQVNKVLAIDIDKCVSKPFDKNSINDMASDIINMFKMIGYIEFSFSGTGIRILLKQEPIKNYTNSYKIKNAETGIEFYQYDMKSRYVTLTGKFLYNNPVSSNENHQHIIIEFLEKYMKKKYASSTINSTLDETQDDRTIEQLLKVARRFYLKDYNFQDLWFTHAPGSIGDESKTDFFLLRYILENITQDREKAKQLFESSDFFKSKDRYHLHKWKKNNDWYYNYMFDNIKEGTF